MVIESDRNVSSRGSVDIHQTWCDFTVISLAPKGQRRYFHYKGFLCGSSTYICIFLILCAVTKIMTERVSEDTFDRDE